MKIFLNLLVVSLTLCLQCQGAEANLSPEFIEKCVNEAKINVDAAYTYSRRQSIERVKRDTASPADILRLLKQPRGVSRVAVRAADYMDNALHLIRRSLEKRHKRAVNDTDLISDADLEVIIRLTGCAAQVRQVACDRINNVNLYRTSSGVCNNIKNTRWGASNTPFASWLPTVYEDKISLPKGWHGLKVNGQVLPLVREVSNHILATANSEVLSDIRYTFLVTLFGQFTDHDLTLTPQSPSIRSFNNGVDCENSCTNTEPCFPIKFPSKDPRPDSHPECMPFFRSAPACGSGNTGYIFGASTTRQQINVLTAFIDASQIYGSDDNKAQLLRNLTSDQGLLKVNTEYNDNGRELLPFTAMGANMCATRRKITNDENAEEFQCFLAGDDRVSENIGLTSIHTLMMREHNRLARALAQLNPHWDGEKLYQEARKIMGAHLQVIIFRDWLRNIVGPDAIANRLSTYPGYDEKVDPRIASIFSTAAFRFAHSMIQPFIFRLNENYQNHSSYPTVVIHKTMFTSWRVLFEGGIDPILRGLVGSKAKLNTQDHILTDELRDRLFKFSVKVALDLASLNMQRGRDHGLPGYTEWRGFCGLSQPKNLKELAKVLNNKNLAKKLLDLYGTPANIDPWLGGVSEPFVRGGKVGPLLACIISMQFQKIRQGDRFWWEKDGIFTDAQKASLRETSLARFICDNTGITDVPAQPFFYRPRGSGYTQCSDIPTFDLSPWKENQHHEPPSSLPTPQGPIGDVAFFARLGKKIPNAGIPIPFGNVIYNKQSIYDSKTGYFTCKRAGLYEFVFYIRIQQKTGRVDLLFNKELFLHGFTTRLGEDIIASGTTYISLNSGDKVWLVASQGTNKLTSDSYFSGHLL